MFVLTHLFCKWLSKDTSNIMQMVMKDQPTKSRNIAYRQYVSWTHWYVGKQIRVDIPSCAVSCIWADFPPPVDEEHFEFVRFLYPDL